MEEYGLLSIISSLIAILCYPCSLYGYWVTRFTAREVKEAVKTGLFLSMLFTLLLTPVYLIAAAIYTNVLGSNVAMCFLMGLPYFYSIYFWYYWRSVIRGLIPEAWGYGLVVGEVVKLILGFLLIVVLRLGLPGVIIALVCSFVSMNLVALISIRKFGVLSKVYKVDYHLIKRWLKNFWIPSINLLSSTLLSSEQIVISIITKSTAPSAFLQVGRVATLPITYGTTLASGLYARLLAKVKVEDVREALKMVFLVNNFVFLSDVVLAASILSLFNPAYVEGALVVVLLAIVSYIDVIANVFNIALIGSERVDFESTIDFEKLSRSYLVKSPLVILIRNASAISISVYLLSIKTLGVEPSSQALTMAYSWLIPSIPMLLALIKMVRDRFNKVIPWHELIVSVIASVPTITYYLVLEVYKLRISIFRRDFFILLVNVCVAFMIYSTTLFLLSNWFRKLCLSGFDHVRRILGLSPRH